jgi:hypothetical protein
VTYVGRAIEDVLCVQEDRVVGADNCVSYKRRSLQIPPQRNRQALCQSDRAGARISRRRARPSSMVRVVWSVLIRKDARTGDGDQLFRLKTTSRFD